MEEIYKSIAILAPTAFGLFGALLVWWLGKRQSVDVELLTEAMRVQGLKEAWIYKEDDFMDISLSDFYNKLQKKEAIVKFLENVEIRAVLDESDWISPMEQFFAFIEGRRTWIVRDEVIVDKNLGMRKEFSYPAIISSKGMEELCAWIENVESSRSPLTLLSNKGLKKIRVLLNAVDRPDRIKVLGRRLTDTAKGFLNKHYKKRQRGNLTKACTRTGIPLALHPRR